MKKDDMDNRIRLPEGYRISHGGRSYTISRYVSAGGNSIVYQAWYQDSLMPEKTHQVLIKEQVPYVYLYSQNILSAHTDRVTGIPEPPVDFNANKCVWLWKVAD